MPSRCRVATKLASGGAVMVKGALDCGWVTVRETAARSRR